MCAAVYMLRHLVKATEVTAGLAESNGSLLPGLWRDSLLVTCGLTACTPGSAPGPTLGNGYGKTLLIHCAQFRTRYNEEALLPQTDRAEPDLMGPKPRPPTNRGTLTKPFIFYFSLVVVVYETTEIAKSGIISSLKCQNTAQIRP